MKKIIEYFLSPYRDGTFIIQHKAKVLFWTSVVATPILFAVSVINLTTAASTHPVSITLTNLILISGFIACLVLIRVGRYHLASAICIIVISARVALGIVIKLDVFARTGSNNNTYFILPLIAFASFFGTRGIFRLISAFFTVLTIALPFAVEGLYHPQNINYIAGTTINVLFSIVIMVWMLYLITTTANESLERVEVELERNRRLGEKLGDNVKELQAANEELNAANEEMEVTNEELISVNRELEIFKEFAEASGQGLFMCDRNLYLAYANSSFRVMAGKASSGSLDGVNLSEFYPPESYTEIITSIIPGLAELCQWTGELVMLAGAGGSRPVLQNIFMIPSHDGGALYYASVVTDITDRKRYEERLVQAQKMEAIGKMAGGIAHDFNNLLTVISGFAQFIAAQTAGDEKLQKAAGEIIKATTLSASLTRHLLAFGRKQIMNPARLNLNFEIENMTEIIRRILGDDIDLSKSLDVDLPNVYADQGQIEQIIINIVINARDAMPEGGRLSIITENVSVGEAPFEGNAESYPGRFVRLTMKDTGTGIEPEVLPHIFEPFYTTKEAGKGTGIGLSVVYGIVKQHNGWVDVQSSGGGTGTSFSIYLPSLPAGSKKPERGPAPAEILRGRGERILLVEDQREVMTFASTALSEYGYTPVESSNASEAIEIFRRDPGRIDLVVSDVIMPDINGIQMAEEMLSIRPGAKIILTSGYTGEKARLDIIREKGIPFIQKPYTLTTLLDTIRKTLGATQST